jgi:alkylated DNA repair dioxygenase AlkB
MEKLIYIPNFISQTEVENQLMFENHPWFPVGTGKNSRMIQHYGYHYKQHEFVKKSKTEQKNIEQICPITPIIQKEWYELIEKIESEYTKHDLWVLDETYEQEKKIRPSKNHYINQIIVNRYEPGQGLGKHTDCTQTYGSIISILSLESGINWEFCDASCSSSSSSSSFSETNSIFLESLSLLILSDTVRNEYIYGIKPRKSDRIQNIIKKREPHISILFRHVYDSDLFSQL